MATILIRHSEKANFRKVTCDCLEPGECDNSLCQTHSISYLLGKQPPNSLVPAIRQCSSWGNDVAYITIWPNVLQIRISDEYLHGDYTGFGAVVTFETDTGECQCRYDDFD